MGQTDVMSDGNGNGRSTSLVQAGRRRAVGMEGRVEVVVVPRAAMQCQYVFHKHVTTGWMPTLWR